MYKHYIKGTALDSQTGDNELIFEGFIFSTDNTEVDTYEKLCKLATSENCIGLTGYEKQIEQGHYQQFIYYPHIFSINHECYEEDNAEVDDYFYDYSTDWGTVTFEGLVKNGIADYSHQWDIRPYTIVDTVSSVVTEQFYKHVLTTAINGDDGSESGTDVESIIIFTKKATPYSTDNMEELESDLLDSYYTPRFLTLSNYDSSFNAGVMSNFYATQITKMSDINCHFIANSTRNAPVIDESAQPCLGYGSVSDDAFMGGVNIEKLAPQIVSVECTDEVVDLYTPEYPDADSGEGE